MFVEMREYRDGMFEDGPLTMSLASPRKNDVLGKTDDDADRTHF